MKKSENPEIEDLRKSFRTMERTYSRKLRNLERDNKYLRSKVNELQNRDSHLERLINDARRAIDEFKRRLFS